MKKKRKKIAVLGAGFLISVLISVVLVGGLFFWQFSTPMASFEEKGDQAFEDGAYATALQHWIGAKDQSENPSELYFKIGNAYLKLANLAQAEINFKKALEKSSRPKIQQQLVRILLAKGDTGGAETLLSGATSDAETDAGVQILYGDLFMLRADFEKGEAAYARAIALEPGVRPRLKLAICLAEQKKRFEADKLVTECRARGIPSPMDLMLLADYYQLAEDEIRAEKTILRAIAADPGNLGLKNRLCSFYRVSGMKEKAGGYLKGLVRDYPDNDGFKMMLTDYYLSLSRTNEAEAMLADLEKRKGDALGYHLLMGKFWLFKGRYSHAVSYFKNALEENYGLVSAHYLLGVAHFAGGQTKLAENAFVHALMVNPNHSETLTAMAGLNYKLGEYTLATQYADRLLDQESSRWDAWQVKGLSAFEQSDYIRATEFFSRAWHLGGDLSSLFFLGQAFEARGMIQEALEAYETVLEKSPEMSDVLYRYARLMASAGKGKQALGMVNKWIKNGQKHPALYYTGARVSLTLKAFDQCRSYLDKAMADGSAAGEFFLLKADLFGAEENDPGVEQALRECTEKRPRFLDGWLRLSGYYVRKQQIDHAFDVLEQGLKSFPNDPRIMGNLAWVLLEKEDDADRALDLARTAYDLLPGEAWLMDTLGWAYYHKKIYSQAEGMLAQAEALAPDNGLIQYHRGMVFYRQGRLSDARETLTSALDCDRLSSMNRDDARQVLSGLNGEKNTDKQKEMFDPETVPPLGLPGDLQPGVLPGVLPEFGGDQEDMLEPDWSSMGASRASL